MSEGDGRPRQADHGGGRRLQSPLPLTATHTNYTAQRDKARRGNRLPHGEKGMGAAFGGRGRGARMRRPRPCRAMDPGISGGAAASTYSRGTGGFHGAREEAEAHWLLHSLGILDAHHLNALRGG